MSRFRVQSFGPWLSQIIAAAAATLGYKTDAENAAAAAGSYAAIALAAPSVDIDDLVIGGPGPYYVNSLGVLILDLPTMQGSVTDLEALPNTVSFTEDLFIGAAADTIFYVSLLGVLLGQTGSSSSSPVITAADRSRTRNAVTKAAIPTGMETAATVLLQKGQSLAAQGGQTAPQLFDTVPINASKVLIPEAGISPGNATWTTLKPAVDEGYLNGVCLGPTIAGADQSIDVALGNAYYESALADTGLEIPVVTCIHAAGGTSAENLGPGSAPQEQCLVSVQRIRDALAGLDMTVGKIKVIWIHDNADDGKMSGPTYARWLMTLQRTDTEDYQAMCGSQIGEVVYYLEQSTVARGTVGEVYEAHQAKLWLCTNMPNQFKWLPASSDLPHAADGTHCNPPQYRIRNRRNGKRIYRDEFRGGRSPISVVDHWWESATTLICQSEVDDPPLVINTDNNGSVVTFNATTDVMTFAGFTAAPVDGTMFYLKTTIGLPPELATGTRYWTRDGSGATCKLAEVAGGAAINISTAGTGTHTAILNGDGIQYAESTGDISATVTFDAATDLCSWANHGFPDGTAVRFAGTLPAELTAGTIVYTRDAITGGFKVAATSGGAAINLSTNGSGTITGTRPMPYVIDVTITDDGTAANGVATFDASTDVITAFPGVTLPAGTQVSFYNFTGVGAPPPEITQGTPVFARDTASGSFKVAATDGGTAFNLSTNGTGTTTAIAYTLNSTANDPANHAEWRVTISSPRLSSCRRRLLIGHLQGPAGTFQGSPGGAQTTLYNSAGDLCDTDKTGASNTLRLRVPHARQVLGL